MIATQVIITRDTATPAVKRLLDACGGKGRRGLHDVMGRSVRNLVRGHLGRLEQQRPNKLGGKRQHFFAQAARSTHHTADEREAVITISHVGIRQRYEGGVIRARKSKWLTIPARAEAYGRRAREFHDLRFAILGTGGPALVQTEQTTIRRTKKGYKQRDLVGGAVLYWLRRSVTQAPDPSVLPTDHEIRANAEIAANQYLDRLQR